jgi:hypothetical protein
MRQSEWNDRTITPGFQNSYEDSSSLDYSLQADVGCMDQGETAPTPRLNEQSNTNNPSDSGATMTLVQNWSPQRWQNSNGNDQLIPPADICLMAPFSFTFMLISDLDLCADSKRII